MPSLPGWNGFLYEKNDIPKKPQKKTPKTKKKRKLDLVTFPFACHFGHKDMVRQWEWGGSRLKYWQNTLMKADLHVNNFQQWFSFPKCGNFPPYPSAQFLRCYEDWCYQPSQDGQITGFSLCGCQITVKLAFVLTTQACLYEARSHVEYSLKTGQIILSFYIYPLRSG